MIRHILATWLILSIFGYGVAMAMDMHDPFTPGQEHSIHDPQGNHDDSDEIDNCDHCCHGGIHLLGLHFLPQSHLINLSQIGIAPYLANFLPPPHQKILRPPIAA